MPVSSRAHGDGSGSGEEAAADAPPTLQLLVSLPWGGAGGVGGPRTRVLPVPATNDDDDCEGMTAGALLAPVLEEAEAAMSRALPPLVAVFHGKRYQMHERLPLAASDAAARASGFDVLHLSLARGGLLGGKGGFGAMLRSMVRFGGRGIHIWKGFLNTVHRRAQCRRRRRRRRQRGVAKC